MQNNEKCIVKVVVAKIRMKKLAKKMLHAQVMCSTSLLDFLLYP